MPKHYDKHISPHKPEELFKIVADVKSYPEFLPWVAGARILEKNDEENWFKAELLIRFKAFSQKYTSKVYLDSPTKIKTDLVEGPFEHLNNLWLFNETSDGKTEIIFELDFKFKSTILEKMIGSMFKKATDKMTESFLKRADINPSSSF